MAVRRGLVTLWISSVSVSEHLLIPHLLATMRCVVPIAPVEFFLETDARCIMSFQTPPFLYPLDKTVGVLRSCRNHPSPYAPAECRPATFLGAAFHLPTTREYLPAPAGRALESPGARRETVTGHVQLRTRRMPSSLPGRSAVSRGRLAAGGGHSRSRARVGGS